MKAVTATDLTAIGVARQPARQTARPWWPAALLTALVEYAGTLVRAPDVAICAWSPRTVRRQMRSVSTSRNRQWLAIVAAHSSGEPEGGYPQRAAGRALAVFDLAGGSLQGVMIVGRPGRTFTAGDLQKLGKVAELAVHALDAEPSQTYESAHPPADGLPVVSAVDFRTRLPLAFARLEDLPVLGASRDVLLSVLDGAEPSNETIVAAIESDVALLIAALRLANETRIRKAARRGPIWSARAAVEVLTHEGVAAMAQRMTVFDFFQEIRGWTVQPEQFRLHALATQRAAERLAHLVDHPEPDCLVVAALLHDVGKLVLMEAFAEYPDRVLGGARTPEERLAAERAQLGIDHQMAGAVLIRRWHLPEELAALVGGHHEATDDRDAALIGLSDMLAHYAHGDPISPPELARVARVAGVTGPQLRTLMYELTQHDDGQARKVTLTSPLSDRETDVLRERSAGRTNEEIALAQGVSTSTVRSHLHNGYAKLGVADNAEALLAAVESGWI
jgi:putative nucleotidyltransferase with HDIG domain